MKKIAICGKGGSGKSVITSLLSLGIRKRGMTVLIIDSDDSNPGLHRMLGFEEPPAPLIDFLGGKLAIEKEIEQKMKLGIPEHKVNVFSRSLTISDIPSNFVKILDRVYFITVGKIFAALEGCACPMGIVSRSFLNELALESNEIALIDLEAGLEHFGRGVETGTDCVLVIVEPSRDSIDVAHKIKQLSDQINIGDTWAILNKMPSAKIADQLTLELQSKGLSVIGSIDFDHELFEMCLKGEALPRNVIKKNINEVLDQLFP